MSQGAIPVRAPPPIWQPVESVAARLQVRTGQTYAMLHAVQHEAWKAWQNARHESERQSARRGEPALYSAHGVTAS